MTDKLLNKKFIFINYRLRFHFFSPFWLILLGDIVTFMRRFLQNCLPQNSRLSALDHIFTGVSSFFNAGSETSLFYTTLTRTQRGKTHVRGLLLYPPLWRIMRNVVCTWSPVVL